MTEMISVLPGFQYSVNIGYDLYNSEKLASFIPTQSSLMLMEEILSSTSETSTERARVLVGAYGKGKSHIVLSILSLLMLEERKSFKQLLPKLKENDKLNKLIDNYYMEKKAMLPVVITGSNTSIQQAFLQALQRTLSLNGLTDAMPDTNYTAAVKNIENWKNNYKETYKKLESLIDCPVKEFIKSLEDYNIDSYKKFESIYPELTSGSLFNPFIGFDVVELYEEAVQGIRKKGYRGIYVIYDEFSKYLESNIKQASVSDTKMLQDFAEKCNRSGESQLHLMLICHKEISNYIDKLPKQKVDGWRGVSERFKHIHLSNNFSQTYEIISSAIQKNDKLWNSFCKKNNNSFISLEQRYDKHKAFSEITDNHKKKVVFGCYPLHPISTFILPRLSERVAQNERTLFTFISSPGNSTLPTFLEKQKNNFSVITPDIIYDYFEPLMKKEVYEGIIHDTYYLTEIILRKIKEESLESKIVKTLSLIYILEQFEKIEPTREELIGIFSADYDAESVSEAINNLIENEYVIYLRKSNNYLRLKQTSGVDIKSKIKDAIVLQEKRFSMKETLNSTNFDNYMYPSKYNNERDMIRYFSFEFIDESEISNNIDWELKASEIEADGVIYGIIIHDEDAIVRIKKIISKTSKNIENIVFIVPNQFSEIEEIVREFNAVSFLRDEANEDQVLFDEYEVIYEDLREVINDFIRGYTRPEEYKSKYYHKGEDKKISRKSALTGLMSEICDDIYSKTPIISNEALNRNEITPTANNSRGKIVAALLRNEIEPNLGFVGSGQEVSIMRSTLVRTGVIDNIDEFPRLNLKSPKTTHMEDVFAIIENFILEAKKNESLVLSELYRRLISKEYHIGIRRGLIPIYFAAVIHEHKKEIVLLDQYGQVPINADVLTQINSKPENFSLSYIDWNPDKEEYIGQLEKGFLDFVSEEEKAANAYDFAAYAMRRWYLSLPKYVKETRQDILGNKLDKPYVEFLRLLKQNNQPNDLLFVKLMECFGSKSFSSDVYIRIIHTRAFFDNYLSQTINKIAKEVKIVFSPSKNESDLKNKSLNSIIKDWIERLDISIFEQLFEDGTDRLLEVFNTSTNDDELTIQRLAVTCTDLRIDDWDDDTYKVFIEKLKQFKNTAENFKSGKSFNDSEDIKECSYQITYIDDAGETMTRRFDKVETSPRGGLLHNQITSALESMGTSISAQEKRQVLIEILKNIC